MAKAFFEISDADKEKLEIFADQVETNHLSEIKEMVVSVEFLHQMLSRIKVTQ